MSNSTIPQDQKVFILEEQQWEEFVATLDAPPANNPGLRALLRRMPAWERGNTVLPAD